MFQRTLLPPPLRPIYHKRLAFRPVKLCRARFPDDDFPWPSPARQSIGDVVAALLGGSGASLAAAIASGLHVLNPYSKERQFQTADENVEAHLDVRPSSPHILPRNLPPHGCQCSRRLAARTLIFSTGQHAIHRPLRDEVFYPPIRLCRPFSPSSEFLSRGNSSSAHCAYSCQRIRHCLPDGAVRTPDDPSARA